MHEEISAQDAAKYIMKKFKIHKSEEQAVTRYLLRTRPEGMKKYTRASVDQLADNEPLLSYLAKKSTNEKIRAWPSNLSTHIAQGEKAIDEYRTDPQHIEAFPWAHRVTPWTQDLLRSEMALNMLHSIYKTFMGKDFNFKKFSEDYRNYWEALGYFEISAQIPPHLLDPNDYHEGETSAEDRALAALGREQERLAEKLLEIRTKDYRKTEEPPTNPK